MKAIDFDMPKEIQYSFDNGITTFKGSRLLVFDTNVMGLFRNNLIQELGKEKARSFFIKLNYQNGYEEFLNMKQLYKFDNEMELLASGPTIHTWRGIVKATPLKLEFNRDKGDFYFTGVWKNSWEAEQYLMYNETSLEAECWSLVGYASGWCSAFFGSKTLAVESSCVAKGAENCGWLIQSEKDCGKEADEIKYILKDF